MVILKIIIQKSISERIFDVSKQLSIDLYVPRYYDEEETETFKSIKCVSSLRGVHRIDLSECVYVNDVSALEHVYDLNLSGCWRITDVSVLKGVHTLNLSKCFKITDVSALGGVDLLIYVFTKITDVSALGNVYDLNLSECWRITDVSALGGVHTLNLSGMQKYHGRECLGRPVSIRS